MVHNRIGGIEKEKISYRLKIEMNPNWERLFQLLFEIDDYAQAQDRLARYAAKAEGNDEALFGSRFVFEEQYDSFSGRTSRTGRRICPNGHDAEVFDDFRLGGSWFASFPQPPFERRKGGHDPHYINIDAQSISVSIVGDGTTWNNGSRYVFDFPLPAVFSFIRAVVFEVDYSISVVKWPHQIEEVLRAQGINYQQPADRYGFKIRSDSCLIELDSSFSDRWGSPVISSASADFGSDIKAAFHSDLMRNYGIEVSFFDPRTNLVPGEGLSIATMDRLPNELRNLCSHWRPPDSAD